MLFSFHLGEHVEYEELEELQEFIHEQDTTEYEVIEAIEVPKASRDQLVEILSNKTLAKTLDADDETNFESTQQNIELIMVDDDVNGDPSYFIEQIDDFDSEMIGDDFTDEQYLEDEEDDELTYAEVKYDMVCLHWMDLSAFLLQARHIQSIFSNHFIHQ